MKNNTKKLFYKSPIVLLVIIATSIFVSEIISMIFIYFLQPFRSEFIATLIDSMFLLLMLSPILYFFIFHPLVLQISQRKRVEEALQEQLYFLQQLLNALPIPVFYKDSQGIYKGCNGAYEKLLGLSEEQVVGKTVYDLAPQDLADIYYQADKELLQNPGVQIYETSVQHTDGTKHEIIYNKATYVRPDGQVAGLIGAIFDITERKQMEQRLLEMATHDTLTGLPNRTLLYDRLGIALANAQRNKKKVAVMSLDLDRFKSINDTLGHAMGDRLLIDAANRLTDVLRKSDTVARIGGDEFILLLGELDGKDDAVIVIQKILEDFRKPFEINEHSLNITVSIGLAIFPEDGNDIENLLKTSDQALYRAKGSGRDRFAH